MLISETTNSNNSNRHLNNQTTSKINEICSTLSSKIKSTFGLNSNNNNNSNNIMSNNKNHLSSTFVNTNSSNKILNFSLANNNNKNGQTPFQSVSIIKSNKPSSTMAFSSMYQKFKDGKVQKKSAKKKNIVNSNFQCFNLNEKEKFRKLVQDNMGLYTNKNENVYQKYIKQSPIKTADDQYIVYDNRRQPQLKSNLSRNNDLLAIDSSSLMTIQNQISNQTITSAYPTTLPLITSTAAKISAGYTRRISVSSSTNESTNILMKPSAQFVDSSFATSNSFIQPNSSITNSYLNSTLKYTNNNNNFSYRQALLSSNNNKLIEVENSTQINNKIARKRQITNQIENEENLTIDLDDDIQIVGVKQPHPPTKQQSHNEKLSANYKQISKKSKFSLNNPTLIQKQSKWDDRLNKNGQIVREILYNAQDRLDEIKLEEEKYKFKKIQRLDKQREEKELADKLFQKLHLEANDLAFSFKEEEAVEEEEEEDEFPELSDEQRALVKSALNPVPHDEVLVEGFSARLTRRDIQTLKGLNWLNDEIINFYMNLICERNSKLNGNNRNYCKTYAFSTFFYPKLIKDGYPSLKRWTRKVDLFSFDIILVPIHLGVHWTLGCIDIQNKEIRYYDSMNGNNHECLRMLKQYLINEYADKKSGAQLPDLNDWQCLHVKDVPQQMNGSDCGMFTCKYAEFISRSKNEFKFNQQHMPYYRERMIWEIITKKLM